MKHQAQAEHEEFENKLKDSINSMIKDKGYYLSRFEYNWSCFGNVLIEISRITDSYKLRIISDRGDIYVQNNSSTFGTWKDKDFYSHLDSDNEYSLLSKAISNNIE